ncbi:MAG: CapA family protein [Caulobacterales bacterium]
MKPIEPRPVGDDRAGRAGRIRLFLCGDVMAGRGVDQILAHPSDPRIYERSVTSARDYVRLAELASGPIPRSVDSDFVWGEALREWRRRAPDLRIANLETSVTLSEDYVPKGINYRMSPANIGCLLAAGFDCCVLANNHVLDWGAAGLLDTLDALGRHGVRTAGAGRTREEATRPAVLETPGRGRLLVVALGSPGSGIPHDWAAGPGRPGVNLTDLSMTSAEALSESLAAVRQPGDIVVVSIHWGANWGYDIPEAQRRFAHALVDAAGVAVVHGHSSHHPKAIEVYKGKLILYGCGDFLNDYEGIRGLESFRGDLTLMYFADLNTSDGSLIALEMTPLRIHGLRLVRPAPNDVGWLADQLDQEAQKFDGHVSQVRGRLALSWPGAHAAALSP